MFVVVFLIGELWREKGKCSRIFQGLKKEERGKRNKEKERGNANNNVLRKVSLLTHLRFFVKRIIIVRFSLIGQMVSFGYRTSIHWFCCQNIYNYI